MKHALIALLLLAGVASSQDTPTGTGLQGSALIDLLIKARWAELSLKPEGRADDAEYLRRVYLDIVGSIPPLAETEKFLADKSTDKRSKLVEALLKNDLYASNWSEIWAGTLVGYDADARDEQARAAVSKQLAPSFEKNLPFDAFTREFITAEGKSPYQKGMAMEAAEGEFDGRTLFYVRYQKTAGREMPAALAGKFSRTFLGTQIQCAQCHDHPFDTWTQEDFYGMAGFFTGVSVRQEKIDDKKEYFVVEDRAPKKRAADTMLIPGTTTKVPIGFLKTREKPKEGEALRAAFARMITSKGNLQFARSTVNRYWGHFFGRGFVNPVDEFNGKNKPSHPELIDAMAKDFIDHNFDLHHLIRSIANSYAYQITSAGRKRDPEAQKYFALSSVRAMMPEQILNSVVTAVASDSTAGAARRDQELRRAIRDFRYAFGDDEGAETVVFEGTIPAALLMMNSQIVAAGVTAVKGKRGTTRLAEILGEHKTAPDRIRSIYLAALTRPPQADELQRAAQYLSTHGGSTEAYEDLLWSLLNSSEFVLNH